MPASRRIVLCYRHAVLRPFGQHECRNGRCVPFVPPQSCNGVRQGGQITVTCASISYARSKSIVPYPGEIERA